MSDIRGQKSFNLIPEGDTLTPNSAKQSFSSIPNSYKVGMISLGCAKNQVDAEVMLSKLKANGLEITSNVNAADAVIINTCGFIESAKAESLENIFEIIELKKEGKIKAVIISGCLSERYKDEIENELPEVDAFIGTGSYDEIVNAVTSALENRKYTSFKDINSEILKGERVLTTPPYTAYLKISEGCDNCCSYCVIPSIRGKFRSRPMEELLLEAKNLASRGVKELCVIAQDTTRYGEDLYGELRLPKLLKELCKIEGLVWIRVLYCYPDRVTDELLDVIASEEKIVKYMDLPIQHISDKILKLMNRKGDKKHIENLIEKIRQKIPQIILRTTVITGFPDESEEDFEELATFIKNVKFERLGAFTYSREEGTPASSIENQIDGETKKRRQDIIMGEQMLLTDKRNKEQKGKTFETLVEGFDNFAECYFGRTYADAPEIDGKVFFSSFTPLKAGDFVKVKITDAIDYDLWGISV